MGERTCSVEGCDGEHLARGFCRKHYLRWWKHGEPTVMLEGRTKILTPCSVQGCETVYFSRGFCNKHYQRWHKHGDPSIVLDVGFQRGDVPTYGALHNRIRRDRGKATDHLCIECGQQASHWAYDHTDPEELFSDDNFPYSPDPGRYRPMCVPCHKVYDLEHHRP